MKRTIIYSIGVSLVLVLTGISDAFAHKVEPKVKNSKVVIVRPAINPHVNYVNKPQVVRSGYVWVDGHYQWKKWSRSYVWVDGRYIKRKNGKTWINGYWRQVKGGWIYQPGSWKHDSRF